MSETQNRNSVRPWHGAWWVPELNKDDRQDSCHRVAEASAPKPSYYVLIVLSTLIAGYGLVSNSTATVIGAMIVAPLMGPILGLALSTVLGDVRMFRRSLIAESTGAVLVVLTGMLVAVAVGTGHIDYKGTEIAGRTSPTLFDLAIGLAAGLAGAYCTVHPGLQASVAGVAIAVALVPPLTVTGLTGAGWLAGESPFEAVFGSFMLFFTNLLTIELASGAVFLAAGFRHSRGDKPKEGWKKTLIVKTVLLLLTGWFLYVQLTNLFQERYGLSTSRHLLETMLKDIPGADLDSLEVNLNKNLLTVRAVVGSRTDIEPPIVARFQRRLDKAIKEGLPDVTVQLVVRTVNSTYASATGYLFVPRRAGLNDDDRRAQALDVILRDLVARFPGVDLVSFNLAPQDGPETGRKKIGLTVTLSTPYDFGPRLVKDLEQDLNEELLKDPLFTGRSYSLLVRSVIMKNSTSSDAVAVSAPEMRTESEKEEAARTDKLRALLTSALEINPGVKIEEIHIRRTDLKGRKKPDPTSSATPGPLKATPTPAIDQETATPTPPPIQGRATPSPSSTATPGQEPNPVPSATPETVEASTGPVDKYSAKIVLRSPQLVSASMLLEARATVEKLYRNETGFKLELDLDTSTVVGSDLYLDSTETAVLEDKQTGGKLDLDELQASLSEALSAQVSKVAGAGMDGPVSVQQRGSEDDYHVFAVVTSPKPLENKTILAWQKTLLKKHPQIKSLDLQLENRQGRTIKLTPIRQAPTPPPGKG